MTTVAAVKGKMGNYEYFQCTMKTKDVITRTQTAVNFFTEETWEEMGETGRVQRVPNLKRVMDEIAPYLVKSKKRFFNSIVVLLDEKKCQFQSLENFPVNVPGQGAQVVSSLFLPEYKSKSQNIGFLTIEDTGHMLILDGQHRMLALKAVVEDQDKLRKIFEKNGENYDDFKNHEVLNDDISIVFLNVPTDIEWRKVFEDLNTYAQKQSKDVEIFGSESNPWYKIVQIFCDNSNLREDFLKSFVQKKGTSLSERATSITTGAHLVQMVKFITDKAGYKNFKKQMQLDTMEAEMYEASQLCSKKLEEFFKNVGVYKKILFEDGDVLELKHPSKKDALLLKPLPQVALFKAIEFLKSNSDMDISTIYNKVNKIDFSYDDPFSQWRDVVISANKTILTGGKVEDRLSRLLVYFIAGKSKCLAFKNGQEFLDKLLNDYRDQIGELDKDLPELITK